jgi:hypothetical protein
MTLFQGKYKPNHPEKYADQNGLNDICFRSSWEKSVMIFLDNHPRVVKWSSEHVVIPYINQNDGKVHRYFMDFYIEFKNGNKLLVEVKPYAQTQTPQKTPGKRIARYLEECQTYVTNLSKWDAAKKYAKKHGMKFQIWTEHELKKLGINLITSKKFRYVNYGSKHTKRHIKGSKK